MRIGVLGHTGTVGRTIFDYYRALDGFEAVGWSLDDKAWDFHDADFAFICVPTPYNNPTGIVREAVAAVQGDTIILIKSTVPPGTTDRLQWEFRQKKLAFCPEFMSAKTAAVDWVFPARQIVGYTGRTHELAKEIFAILPNPADTPGNHYFLPAAEAEILKYIHNLHGAMQIILANHWYDVCEAVGADFERVKEAAPTPVLSDAAIGTYWNVFQDSKRGYLGACFPKDTETFLRWAEDYGVRVELFAAMQAANRRLLGAQGLTDGIEREDRTGEAIPAVAVCECCGEDGAVRGCQS